MNKLREWILAHRKLVVAVFLAAADRKSTRLNSSHP